jgi:hypothetical protein
MREGHTRKAVPVLRHNAGNASVSSKPVQQLLGLAWRRAQARPLPSLKALERVGACMAGHPRQIGIAAGGLHDLLKAK